MSCDVKTTTINLCAEIRCVDGKLHIFTRRSKSERFVDEREFCENASAFAASYGELNNFALLANSILTPRKNLNPESY